MPTPKNPRTAKLPHSWLAAAAVAALATLPSCKTSTSSVLGADAIDRVSPVVQHASRKTLTAFESEADLEGFLVEYFEAQEREQRERAEAYAQPGQQQYPAAEASPPPAEPESADASGADGDESVTNVQHAGVDEGGIVKVRGDHLVVLRRGRLFTVAIGDDALTPISSVDAFGPDIDPNGTWYDEMLVSDRTIAVIGYSYSRGGTEVGLFDLDDRGGIEYRSTYHLRSNDYYSSRNYASRLIGDKLVFYTPLYLGWNGRDVFSSFPALRKWHAGATDGEFQRIVSASNVYRPIMPSRDLALHTVTTCDLSKRDMTCEASAVFGPPGRVFYVSPGSVFVWTTDFTATDYGRTPRSLVYRLPLDGSGPSALRARGGPVDQFSFLERDGFLNVLVRADGAGDAMWTAETTGGATALFRVPLASFSDGDDEAPRDAYRSLPKPEGYTFQNRFVGDHLLYGTGSGWGDAEKKTSNLFAVRYASSQAAAAIPLAHGVDRIEALGSDAVVVGTDGADLSFSPVALGGVTPRLAERYVRKNASQGELRSHGFFYKPDGERSGLLGLPIAGAGRPGFHHLVEGSASVLFLRNDALRLKELGALGARPESALDDGCRASCVDWYGNARPLFLKKRVFALLGYELVEGTLREGGIAERRRVSFAPRLRVAR